MQCPKCGETVGSDAVICPRCDYILDTSFLGDDITNEHTTGKQKPVRVTSAGDAVVIGGLDEEVALFSESTGSFLTADTMDVERAVVPAALYVGKSVQELMKPEAVLRPAPDVDKRKSMLSPFELHVLSFIDGKRPVARIRKKTGLSPDDVRIAVGMLAEKGAVELKGFVDKPKLKDLLGAALSSEEEDDPTASHEDPDSTTPDSTIPVLARAGLGEPVKKSGEWKPAIPELELEDVSSSVVSVTPSVSTTSSNFAAAAPSELVPSMPDVSRIEVPAVPVVSPIDAAALEKRQTRERAAGFFELAHVELNKGNRVRAHVYAKLAADTDPDEPKYRELLKKWPVAARAAATTDAALFADADVAEKQGNHHKALALLEQALAANPNAAHIHNRVGLLLATRFKRFSKASEHLMRACELEPDNVVYKNNLGKIIAVAHDKGSPMSKKDSGVGLLGKLKKALE